MQVVWGDSRMIWKYTLVENAGLGIRQESVSVSKGLAMPYSCLMGRFAYLPGLAFHAPVVTTQSSICGFDNSITLSTCKAFFPSLLSHSFLSLHNSNWKVLFDMPVICQKWPEPAEKGSAWKLPGQFSSCWGKISSFFSISFTPFFFRAPPP